MGGSGGLSVAGHQRERGGTWRSSDCADSWVKAATTRRADADVDITFGIEEEFFLVGPDSRDMIADPDPGIFDWCEKNRGPHGFVHEFLRSQIETNTRVCVVATCEPRSRTRRVVTEAAAVRRHRDGRLDPSLRGVGITDEHAQGTVRKDGKHASGKRAAAARGRHAYPCRVR